MKSLVFTLCLLGCTLASYANTFWQNHEMVIELQTGKVLSNEQDCPK
ncbi:MAG: hypothetical protein ACI94Y_003955, partial [Maribacter sp.]